MLNSHSIWIGFPGLSGTVIYRKVAKASSSKTKPLENYYFKLK